MQSREKEAWGFETMLTDSEPFAVQIRKFDAKVDLRDAGVRVGEGQVNELVKELPAKVVLLRMMGLYHTLYIVRSVD